MMASNSNAKMSRKIGGLLRKVFVYLLVVVVVAAIAVGFWPQPTIVEVVEISRGGLVVSVLEEGQTRIRERYMISPPIGGELRRVTLREGDPVVAGETVLAVIDAEPPAFLDPRQRAEARARLAASEANRTRWESEVARANAALELAEKKFARIRDLREGDAISDQEWDVAESEVRVLNRARGAAEASLNVAEYEINQAKAALMEASEFGEPAAEPLEIRSPIDGFVLAVYEENSRVLMAGTAIMEVGDPRSIEAEIELLSSDAVGVSPGAEVTFERWGGDSDLKGKVTVVERSGFTKVSALGVEEQRVIVRADFTEELPDGLELGDRFRVEARIVTWRGDDVLLVPTGALFRRGNDWMCFVFEEGMAKLRTVEVGHNNASMAEVLSGLAESDRVVLHPPDTLTDGAIVSLLEEEH